MTQRPGRDITVLNAIIHRPGGAYDARPRGVVVSDGMITYVGAPDEARERSAPGAPMVDAGGRYLLPGLIESHGHPGLYARSALQTDCRPSATPRAQDIEDAVRAAAETAQPGSWVLGWGYDEHRMTGRGPTREDLDRAAPEHPVFVRRTCAHMGLVNTAALERMGITDGTPDPPGGRIVRDGTGRPTGLLQEKAMSLADLPADTPDDLLEGMRRAQRDLAAWGVTTVHDMSSGALEMGAYQRLLTAGELDVRLRPWYFALAQGEFTGNYDAVLGAGLRSGFGNDMLRIQGLKFVLDGSVGGRTAAVAEPFEGSETRGILYYDTPDVAPLLARALGSGLRVAVHGIGERAVTQALDLIEGAGREVASAADDARDGYERAVRSRRHRVEHCALPTEDELERLVAGGIIAASSTAFLYELGDSYLANLGPERIKRAYPMRTFIDRGITAPSNSDFPVTTPNPWLGIYACVARTTSSGQPLDTEQNITLAEALDAYTTVAARASFEEDRLGRVEEGFLGDLVLVDRNPFEVPVDELKDVRAVLTVCDGREVHRAADGPGR